MTTVRTVALERVAVVEQPATDNGITERWLESVKRRKPMSEAVRLRMGATRIGVSVEEYTEQVRAGMKWCCGHKRWCKREDFGPHKRTRDGLNTMCREANREIARPKMAAIYAKRRQELNEMAERVRARMMGVAS